MCSFNLCGCDWIYRILHKEGAQEKEIIGEIDLMAQNETVLEVQRLLKIYGYNPGSIDGVLGGATRSAIVRFQTDNELNPTRFIDQATWAKLIIFKDNGFIVNGSLNVKKIQQLLLNKGFNPGKIDGMMGDKTKEAIKNFQQQQGIKTDGKIGYQTLLKLSQLEGQ